MSNTNNTTNKPVCGYTAKCNQTRRQIESRAKGGQEISMGNPPSKTPTPPKGHCRWGDWYWSASASAKDGTPIKLSPSEGTSKEKAKTDGTADWSVKKPWHKYQGRSNCVTNPPILPGCTSCKETGSTTEPGGTPREFSKSSDSVEVTVNINWSRESQKRGPSTGYRPGNCDVPNGKIPAGSKSVKVKISVDTRNMHRTDVDTITYECAKPPKPKPPTKPTPPPKPGPKGT
jgi:hypothetical protein